MRMNLFYLVILLSLLGCGAKSKQEFLNEMAADADKFTYLKVAHGFYEESLYQNKEVSEVVLDFEVLNIFDEGEWVPLNSVLLKDLSTEKTFYAKYIQTSTKRYINIHIYIDGQSYFDEDIDLIAPISQLKVSWNDREVQVKAEGFEYAIGVPFDVHLYGNGISSMEVINRISVY